MRYLVLNYSFPALKTFDVQNISKYKKNILAYLTFSGELVVGFSQ
jgi:hypothetical protein